MDSVTKQCVFCGYAKLLKEYHNTRVAPCTPDGKHSWCIECHSMRDKCLTVLGRRAGLNRTLYVKTVSRQDKIVPCIACHCELFKEKYNRELPLAPYLKKLRTCKKKGLNLDLVEELLAIAATQGPPVCQGVQRDTTKKQPKPRQLRKYTGNIYETRPAKSRKCQAIFKNNVLCFEKGCRVTKVTDERLVTAGHLKPYRDCTTEEAIDGENGLLFTPSIDRLVDKGYISFADDGSLLVSPNVSKDDIRLMGVDENVNIGTLTSKQKEYLAYHRDNVFQKGKNHVAAS